jgi:hypothetical protein
MLAVLAAFFAIVALILAALGLYGLMWVRQHSPHQRSAFVWPSARRDWASCG